MFNRCKHFWEERSRFFTESPLSLLAKRGGKLNAGYFANQDAYDRWLHGFTSIELRCKHCGDIKVYEFIGQVDG